VALMVAQAQPSASSRPKTVRRRMAPGGSAYSAIYWDGAGAGDSGAETAGGELAGAPGETAGDAPGEAAGDPTGEAPGEAAPDGADGGEDDATEGRPPVRGISVDIPDLPPHIPGLIPLGLVVNGYVDDLREQYAEVTVEARAPTKLAGANARRVKSRWRAGSRAYAEDAVLAVHGDRVYILRLTADAAEYPSQRPTFEDVLQSLQWLD